MNFDFVSAVSITIGTIYFSYRTPPGDKLNSWRPSSKIKSDFYLKSLYPKCGEPQLNNTFYISITVFSLISAEPEISAAL